MKFSRFVALTVVWIGTTTILLLSGHTILDWQFWAIGLLTVVILIAFSIAEENR